MLTLRMCFFFFFNDTATTEIYTLSYTTLFRSSTLRPTSGGRGRASGGAATTRRPTRVSRTRATSRAVSSLDRKSTRLNSSHLVISYAVFCLKKKKQHSPPRTRAAPLGERSLAL